MVKHLKQIVAVMIVFSLAATTLWAGGKKEEAGAPTVIPGEPQYGGTLTQLQFFSNMEPASWYHCDQYYWSITWWSPVYEITWCGDPEKYGPRGSNQYKFQVASWVPEEFLGGQLVDSWEVTTEKLTFHVHPGVYWTGKSVNPGVMERREFTADDLVYHCNMIRNEPKHAPYYAWISDTYAADKYTWVVEMGEPFAEWFYWLSGAWFQILPHETVEAGPRDWKNMVGTGPFLMTNYVKGSYAEYDKNPDYWDTTTIDGKVYKTPFIDKLIWPIIVDESTRIAALRTGKADWMGTVPLKYEASLDKSSPDLVKYPYVENSWVDIGFQCKTSEYFDDVNVRRAMMKGLDIKAIGAAVLGKYELTTPLAPVGESWRPTIDELPAATKDLYTYDPVKAKEMLAAAGFPNGFNMEMTYCPTYPANAQDYASMIVAMWAKIGVNCKLVPVEEAVFNNYVYGHDYKDCLLGACGADGTPTTSLVSGVSGSSSNSADWEDKWFTDSYTEAFRMGKDIKEANDLKRQMVVYHTDQCPYIALPCSVSNCYAWPWVKNYYGELECSFFHYIPMIRTLWLDLDLKAKMGF